MRILYVGPLWQGGTCLQRMQAMQDLGHEILPVDTEPDDVRDKQKSFFYRVKRKSLGPSDLADANQRICQLIKEDSFDVLWIDKGLTIKPETLRQIKIISPKTVLIHYNPDDPFGELRGGWRIFLKSAHCYDIHFVPRQENITEYQTIGCKKVFRFYRGYGSNTHHPIELSEKDKMWCASDVCFIGNWEVEREKSLAYLASCNISVSIWGKYWNRGKCVQMLNDRVKGQGVWGREYAKVLCGAKICLGFLRKQNRDKQNSRSIEIPACGAFMLAERTNEHLELFKEGKEAEFFSTNEELLEKVHYYLNHEDERKRIARNGRERCLRSGYSNHDRIKEMLATVEDLRE